jgi:hypothetical protein
MLSDWVSFLAYPNLFGIKGFVVVVVDTHFAILIVQRDNVSNQREHVILLLANVHVRKCPKPDNQPKVSTNITLLPNVCSFFFLFHFSFSLLSLDFEMH